MKVTNGIGDTIFIISGISRDPSGWIYTDLAINKSFCPFRNFLFISFPGIIVFLVVLLQSASGQSFDDNNGGSHLTFSGLLANMTDGTTAVQTSNYTWETGSSMNLSMTLDLDGYTLSNPDGYVCMIGDGKWFALKSTATGGHFSGIIGFGGITTVLKVWGNEVLGAGFSIDAGGSQGTIEIGDGVTPVTQTLSFAQTSAVQVRIVVRPGATHIVNPG